MGCCQKGCPHTYHYACAIDTGEPCSGDRGVGTPPAPSDPAEIGARVGWWLPVADGDVLLRGVCVPNLAGLNQNLRANGAAPLDGGEEGAASLLLLGDSWQPPDRAFSPRRLLANRRELLSAMSQT